MKAEKIPCEHHLLSSDDKIWANAVMRCKGVSPFCGGDGYCHGDGSCFVDQNLSHEQAILEIDRLAQELHQLKQENNVLRSNSESLVQQLEFILDHNKKKGFSERVFALRYCINEIKRILGFKPKH